MRPTTAALALLALLVCSCNKLSSVLQDEPPREQQARTLLANGRAALAKKDLGGAQQALEKAAALSPTDPEPQRTLGAVYDQLGQETQAIFALKRAVELSPGDPGPSRELAELYLRSGQPAPAVDYLRKATEASAGEPDPELSRRLAFALMHTGQADEAQKVLERLDRASPGDADTMALMAEVLIARRQEERAVKLLDAAVEAHPDSARVRNARAKYFYSRGKVSEALHEFELATKAAPDDAEIGLARARALASAGRAEEAAQLMDKIVEERPADMAAQASLAEVKLLAKDINGAREVAEAVIARQPKNGRALYVRARAIEGQSGDDPVRAINAYKEAIDADPDQIEALSRLWGLYKKQGRAADAISTLERLEAIGEATPEEEVALVDLYVKTGYNLSGAQRLAEECLRKDPGNARLVGLKRQIDAKVHTPPKGNFGVQVIKGGH